jgi:hypothetical protein
MMSFRSTVGLGAVAFCVTLAVIIGVRLDQAALATVVGVACGIGASIPSGVLVIMLLRRREGADRRQMRRDVYRHRSASPPVVVVSPPTMAQLPQRGAWSEMPMFHGQRAPAQREFAVIGEEGFDDDVFYWQE